MSRPRGRGRRCCAEPSQRVDRLRAASSEQRAASVSDSRTVARPRHVLSFACVVAIEPVDHQKTNLRESFSVHCTRDAVAVENLVMLQTIGQADWQEREECGTSRLNP